MNNERIKPEILSPAGSLEGIYAAAAAGADAIYFGGGDFNARRNAKNLTNDEIELAIRHLNLCGVKSYLTVNTLLSDRELRGLLPFLEFLNDAGASAVIVQDLGVARIIRKAFPDMPMIGSTQMSIMNLDGAKLARELGFSRVVLARELTLGQIGHIAQNAGIETEVFAHGALCMCYSGQCYMSGFIGGRSGNRGLCAQPCRKPYTYGDSKMKPLLSLKDLNLIDYLDEISQAGVTSIKIEGRMKRPEYTAFVTHIYRRAIDNNQPPTNEERRKLHLLFSREGFTDGYLRGKKGEKMFGTREEGDSAALQAIYDEARALYVDVKPNIPLALTFHASAGKPIRLVASSRNIIVETHGDTPAVALKKASTDEEIKKNLSKTGGTSFVVESMDVQLDEGLNIPLSGINSLRREAILELTKHLSAAPIRRKQGYDFWISSENRSNTPEYVFSFLKREQISQEILEMNPAAVYIPLREFVKHANYFKSLIRRGINTVVTLDRIISDDEWVGTIENLKRAKECGAMEALCTNLGHIRAVKDLGYNIRGDYSLNIFNSQALRMISEMGVVCQTLSLESHFAQIRDISKVCDTELIVYGRLPLMITENCVMRDCKKSGGDCTNCTGLLKDSTGREFVVIGEPNRRNTIYNADILYLGDKRELFERIGIRYARLNFTTEDARECLQIAQAYLEGKAVKIENITRGLYTRGVE